MSPPFSGWYRGILSFPDNIVLISNVNHSLLNRFSQAKKNENDDLTSHKIPIGFVQPKDSVSEGFPESCGFMTVSSTRETHEKWCVAHLSSNTML